MYLHDQLVHKTIIEGCTGSRNHCTGFPDAPHRNLEKTALSEWNIQAKTSAVKENGKHSRRKRFGKSLQSRAPAQFCSILERKITALGGRYLEVDTRSFCASQYDHATDTDAKKKLSRRHAIIDGHWVQRDLYSAFLLSNSSGDLSHADRDRCIRTFDQFLKNQDACIAEIRNTKKKIARSFGFQAA